MSVIKALFAAIAIASIAWIAVDRWAPSKAVSQSVPSLDCQGIFHIMYRDLLKISLVFGSFFSLCVTCLSAECQSVARGVSDFLATAANAKLEAGTG